MNISEVRQQLASLLSKAGNLIFTADDDYGKQLVMGQILKGKVLRSYDNGRYLMDFKGEQKVVDSSVPLKTGELIHGRVVGLGDKVELKKLVTQDDHLTAQNVESLPSRGLLNNRWETLLLQGMQKFNVKFNSQERDIVISQMKKADFPQAILMNAMVLSFSKNF